MRCSIEGCPGEYEERTVIHTVRHHGEVVVIDHVPAEVCNVCSDVLFRSDTMQRIEKLLETAGKPAKTAAVYEFA